MRYLRSIFLVSLALVMMPQSLLAYQTKLKYQSKAYNAGRAATIIEDACGRYDLSNKLYNEFGSQGDFIEGLSSLSIQNKDDTSIDCGAIERWIQKLLPVAVLKPNFANFNNHQICQEALKINETKWDDENPLYSAAVKEAKSRGLTEQGCGRILGRATAVASSSTSSSLVDFNNYLLCQLALKINETSWDHKSSTSRSAVWEARARDLTEQDCARILNRTNALTSYREQRQKEQERRAKAKRIYENQSDSTICKFALTGNNNTSDFNSSYFKIHVEVAKSRGLDEQDCARILGLTRSVANSRQMNSANSETNRSTTKTSDTNSLLGSLSERRLCNQALTVNGTKWDDNDPYFRLRVDEAKSRGLSEHDCAIMLGRTKTVASKPDPKPSYALIKRTQEALKSLGLYQGKIDGVIGIQSRSGLKRWQKQKGFADTGKIEEAQIVKLESDALAIIAKREEERKEKAKRLAEANRIKNPDAIAVIIGNRDYEGSTPDVDFAGNDADAMKRYVLNKLGYRPGNIIDLRDATKARLEATFGTKDMHKGKLYDYVRADESDVIVFYSGHGVPGMSDRRGYLLSVDADPNRAELTGYPVDVLLKNLAKVPAKSMMVFIDACFSGQSPKGIIVNSMSGLTVKITSPKKSNDKMIVVTASRGDEAASWDNDAKHGLFTKYLLEALNGEADKHAKTGNKDGKVTLGEVKAYLDREMTYQARRRFSRDQHATVSGDLRTVLFAY